MILMAAWGKWEEVYYDMTELHLKDKWKKNQRKYAKIWKIILKSKKQWAMIWKFLVVWIVNRNGKSMYDKENNLWNKIINGKKLVVKEIYLWKERRTKGK